VRPEESREMGILGEGVYPSAPARGSREWKLETRLGCPAEIEFSAF